MSELMHIAGKTKEDECPKSDDGKCPECGEDLECGYGFASGYGLGGYWVCDDHGFFDFSEDSG